MKQNSKEQLKSLITKQQEQMKKEQIEISELETTNKSLAEKTSLGEVEITKLQTEEKLKIAENLELEESITELDSKIENLNKAITAKKADSNFMYPKTLRESAVAQKPPNKITPIRAHNWDSDTSFEGEDRSYAERGRLKLKLPMLKKATVK
ncbi:hypothetical protein JTB14_029877 [Gonioctena quinquepunctata]|nr:hypothetical protein JTB14_029877 [Gonioctena quinquepunctata]